MADKPKDKAKSGKDKISDGDAIDALPLAIIPLSNSSLRAARLVKNSRLETSLEIHNDPIAGSLQINPADVVQAQVGSAEDQKLLEKLAQLPSYDIYSLRTSLRRLNIPVDDPMLQLSDNMKETLQRYTHEFVHPLMVYIFGNQPEADAQANLMKFLTDTDKLLVAKRLKTMSQQTGMSLAEIPPFLASYSDVFLSVAYYRHTFHSIVPDVSRFRQWLEELRTSGEDAPSPRTLAGARQVESSLRFLTTSLRERLARFQASFELFWQEVNAETFARLQREIEENHASMGAVLCGVVVKMRGWAAEFPDNEIGSPTKRAQYIITQMEPGLDQLLALENSARERLGLSSVQMF